jgi:hypothetical protein
MKRIALASLAAALAVACQDSLLLDDIQPPQFAVSDATTGGTEGFYILPPLRPQPDEILGEFADFLEPTITIAPLANEDDDTCIQGDPIAVFHDEIAVDPVGETYSVGWQTGPENGVISGQPYRICFSVGETELGYRDVQGQDEPVGSSRDVAQDPIYGFNNGRNIPISFFATANVLCSRDAIDCTVQVFDSDGGQAVCDEGTCGLYVAPGAVAQGEQAAFIVENLSCDDYRTTDGRIRYLDIDLPQFANCMDVTPVDPNFGGLLVAGSIVASCPIGVPAQHAELVQIHHQRQDGVVEALPNTFFSGLDCEHLALDGSTSGRLMNLARRGWNLFQRVAAPWSSPPPAYAGDRGVGGMLPPGDDSPMVWALPSQMRQYEWTNPEVGEDGEDKTVQVLVTDADDNPVAGATVRFDLASGADGPITVGTETTPPAVAAVTDASGIAQAVWTLGPLGEITALARGNGIGIASDGAGYYVPAGYTPPGGSGVFADHTGGVADLAQGVLTFDAIVCDPGPAILVDGFVDDANWATATSWQFPANISGGEVNAILKWYNDCESLYLSVEVETANDKVNILGFDFDEDNDGFAALNDEVLVFDAGQPEADRFMDKHVSQKCLNSNGQSACGDLDDTSDGAGGFSQDFTAARTYYEVSHPLMGADPTQDFQLEFGDQIGFFVTLRVGKGAQGNTQYPDFRSYCTISIVPGGGSSSISCPTSP